MLHFAYLDPGTGSIIIQALIGAIVAVGVVMKSSWHKVSKAFTKNKKDTKESDS